MAGRARAGGWSPAVRLGGLSGPYVLGCGERDFLEAPPALSSQIPSLGWPGLWGNSRDLGSVSSELGRTEELCGQGRLVGDMRGYLGEGDGPDDCSEPLLTPLSSPHP